MSETPDQNNVDSLLSQMEQNNNALASDSQALDQAAQLATDIAGEIHAADIKPAPVPAAPVADMAESPPALEPQRAGFSPDLQRLLAIEVPVIVQLGVRRMNVGEVMRFSVGAIIEFSKSAEEELELLANNKSIGKGHAVKVGENFGIKLSAIAPVKETIRKLGAA